MDFSYVRRAVTGESGVFTRSQGKMRVRARKELEETHAAVMQDLHPPKRPALIPPSEVAPWLTAERLDAGKQRTSKAQQLLPDASRLGGTGHRARPKPCPPKNCAGPITLTVRRNGRQHDRGAVATERDR